MNEYRVIFSNGNSHAENQTEILPFNGDLADAQEYFSSELFHEASRVQFGKEYGAVVAVFPVS